jgi:DNA-binding CsgD family transcriptional regulator
MPERRLSKSSSRTGKKDARASRRTASHDLSSVPPHRNLRIDKVRIGSDEYVVMSWPRDVESATLAALTAAERAVTKLVLSGKSNAEIARQRGTSPRTIANQLASLYRKLGVRSRRELSARFAGF